MSKRTSNGTPSTLLAVPEFDPDLLPDVLRPWIIDIAERMQCPIDFPAVSAMIVLAAAVGRKVGMRPKMRDAWLVIANLWGLLIGRPGIMKSPPMKETHKPLVRICDRAGVQLWERAFQNMRATRETELTQEHPLHVVVAWLGNSAPIAARHYLQVTDADFDRAVERGAKSGALEAQNQAQQTAGDSGRLLQETTQAPDIQGLVQSIANPCNAVQTYLLPPRGVEPLFSG